MGESKQSRHHGGTKRGRKKRYDLQKKKKKNGNSRGCGVVNRRRGIILEPDKTRGGLRGKRKRRGSKNLVHS